VTASRNGLTVPEKEPRSVYGDVISASSSHDTQTLKLLAIAVNFQLKNVVDLSCIQF
jgi:hypothetical protein